MANVVSNARARFLRGSPQKFRLVIDQVRGRPVPEALGLLQLSKKRAAKPVETLSSDRIDKFGRMGVWEE